MIDGGDWKSADELFKKFDVNGDGVLDQEEFFLLCEEQFGEEEVKGNEWRLRDIFEKLDVNQDRGLKGAVWKRIFTEYIKPIVKPVNVLIVVDVQNDFIEGTLALRKYTSNQDGADVVEPINRLSKEARWDKVIYSLDWHPENHISFYENLSLRELHPTSKITKENAKPFDSVTFLQPHVEQTLWPRHCVMGTWGAELHKDLQILPESEQVHKGQDPDIEACSVFTKDKPKESSRLEKMLRKIGATDLYVCGLATDVCVKATCLDGLKLGYKVAMIEDCCRGVDNDNIEEAKRSIVEHGGLLTNSDRVICMVNEGRRSLIMAHHAANIISKAPSIPVDDKYPSTCACLLQNHIEQRS
ncbi:hypothetical protein KPH14_007318 [Odynerus spinipes]|uniref:nicotinamidase n=1 Tax=Odynerus spinipes TaxID=1348599 RepID=A0AAD9VJH3_9HYME|nr:hypothetical protein KPH14_007318 [Odynerus spinipes]